MKYSLVTCFLPGGLSGRRAPAGVGGERYRTANPVSMPKKTRKYPPNASQEEWKPKLCPPPNVGSDFQPLTNVVPPSLCLGRAQGFLAQPESYRCKVLSGEGLKIQPLIQVPPKSCSPSHTGPSSLDGFQETPQKFKRVVQL